MDKNKKLNIPIYPLGEDKKPKLSEDGRKLLEGKVEEVIEKMALQKDLNIIDDIIDIYNGKCKKYGDYVERERKRAEQQAYFQQPYFQVMPKHLFDYIVKKGKEDGK